ncbi:thiolase domain-containing protein [Sulfolobus acidocaldarius]|uniref:thiolase domain-containing protein n=1 Tax=Sulfolobus acidocaldarius TaxID=2285 RepID=UPI000784CDB8|nr:thiolase domain-containing protein [Sulfolobus acidocaldarius]
MSNVAIVGTGHTKFGVRTDVNLQELTWEAVKQALEEANLEQKDIEMFVVGNAGGWSSEPLSAIAIGEYCNLAPKGTMRVEAACATGSAAIRIAYQAIKSGEAKVALVIGVEQMNQSPHPVAVEMMGRAGNYFWEFENFGLTFPGYYALYATRRMAKYGMKEEDLGSVAVKNHYYGSYNPYATFQKQIKMEDYLKSRVVAYPLKLYDACPITDGAAALILASEEVARKITDSPVWIVSQGFASGTINLSKREEFLTIDASRVATEEAYKRAKIDFSDAWRYFDVADVHDCFTIAEIMADGGLKAKGHPIGATGVSMAVSITRQLLYRAHKGTQADIRNGMGITHNVGGTGHYAYITIYSTRKPNA